MPRAYRAADLIDFDLYPLNRPDSAEYKEAIENARAELNDDGCAIIRNLIRPTTIRIISDEIRARKHLTHFSLQSMNPYFHTKPSTDFPDRHPMNTFIERSSGFIPGDAWGPELAIDILFRSHELTKFLCACLEIDAMHCYADPLAGLTANILEPGQQFAWHFDTNEFAVTVLVDEADEGGLFEYAPGIRTPLNENFEGIQSILEDDRENVRTIDLRSGDLQIFKGRYSLHRVTRVPETSKPRHTAIFAYTLEPGVIGRLERTNQLFGRVLPAHEEAEKLRVRSDTLTD